MTEDKKEPSKTTRAAVAMRTTGRSSRSSDSRKSPVPGEDGTGHYGKPDKLIVLRGEDELMMRLIVLAVPDCPNVMLLEERLAQVLEGRRDAAVSRLVVADEEEAARRGMHGSPTILVDGVDPFAGPGQSAGLSCRLYRHDDGKVDGAPSVSQLRQAIGASAVLAGWVAGGITRSG